MSQSEDKPKNAPTAVPAGTQPGEVTPSDQQKAEIAQFVTTIRNPAEQVGLHVIEALQHDDTVAVLTTVALGADGQQRVISAALDPERMKQVQEILAAAESEREPEEPCIGFHCLIKPKKDNDRNITV
ncbi:hypothetical protein NHH03_10160 [Stieleria sp. TO1_6]|uniref:hypothetical protein n=1 Tax=Stieleria tagensis TaxID=2956795 RepID=UPI00209B9814|nr:hypothetical protein [Stieleria tagensis]MCO8122102.1 hypothetical protein [Stieleria tagensis]